MAAGEEAKGEAPAEGSAFTAVLTTLGRNTGREHSKTLRAVRRGGRIYFSRHRPDSDWFRNALRNPAVWVRVAGGERVAGRAAVVRDGALSREISRLKYPGEARAGEARVVLEVTLCGLP